MSDFKRNELEERKLAEFKPVARAPIPEPDFEDEEEEDEGETSSVGKFRILLPIIILAIVSFVSYAWYTDKFAISRNSGADLPVVKASADALREKPEDPGGMKIINRDKRVYDAISGKDNDKDKKAENLLPAPEEPITHNEVAKITGEKPSPAPELINKLPEEKQTDDNTNTASTNAASPEKIAPAAGNTAPLENVTIASRPEPTPEPAVVATTPTPAAPKASAAPAPTVVKEAKVEKTVKAVTADDIKDVAPKKKAAVETIKKAPTTHSGYRVQLGSYRSEGDAEISWKNIKKKFPTILDGLSNYVEKADLKEKGIYYRLQISGFKNEADARKVCQALTEKKQECFFVGK